MTDVERARKEQTRRYRNYLNAASDCRERAMSESYEPRRRALMTRADELAARAYHEVA